MAHIVTPFDDPAERARAGVFGMLAFIASLAMIFAATILGVVVVRLEDDGTWPPVGLPGLPSVLAWSTIVLLVSSGTMWMATRAARVGDARRLARWMTATFALAIVFLALQGWAWWRLVEASVDLTDHLYAWTVYVLTALHALHVLGGIGPMAVVTWNAIGHRYSVENHRGVTYVGLYWHFLDLAWLGLYGTLFWATHWR
jgi:heme/copper-type cytochrome/quinol oxidase subunit 3